MVAFVAITLIIALVAVSRASHKEPVASLEAGVATRFQEAQSSQSAALADVGNKSAAELQALREEQSNELRELKDSHRTLLESYEQLRTLLSVSIPGTSVTLRAEVQMGDVQIDLTPGSVSTGFQMAAALANVKVIFGTLTLVVRSIFASILFFTYACVCVRVHARAHVLCHWHCTGCSLTFRSVSPKSRLLPLIQCRF